MDTSDDDMQSDQMDSLEVDPLARGDEDMEGGGRPPKRRKVKTGMTNLQIESCLKDYPATVCCADELPTQVGVSARTFIVNTDTWDVAEVTGWRFTFPSWDPQNFSIRWETHRKRITAVYGRREEQKHCVCYNRVYFQMFPVLNSLCSVASHFLSFCKIEQVYIFLFDL